MRTTGILRPCLLAALACLASGGLPPGVDAGTAVIAVAVGPTLEIPFLASHYFQTAAVLADGSFALSGTTTIVPPGTDGFPQFEVQTYASDGSLLGSPFVPEEGRPVDTGGVVPLGDRYFVSWQHYLAKTSSATFIGQQGEGLAEPFAWPNSDIEYYHFYYAHSGGSAYRFLPVMYHQEGVDPFDNPVRQPTLQVYGPDAKPIGANVVFSSSPSRIYIDQMAINGKGRFVVLYQRCAKRFFPVEPCPLGLQVFEGGGQPQTDLLTKDVAHAESAQGSLSGGVYVGIAPSGMFLLCWAVRVNDSIYRLFVRPFDRQGTPLSQPLLLAEVPPAGFGEEHVRGLADGSFALSWAVAGDPGIVSIYVSRFNPFSLQASLPTLITTDRLAAEDHHFDVNDSGQGIVTWATYHPENPDNVFAGHLRLIRFPPYRVPKQLPPVKQRP